jgi:exodeoxyribonuclease-1
LLLSETAGGVAYNLVVTPITNNASNANEWALFDLQSDPAEFVDASDEKLREAIDGDIKIIRRVSVNAQPGLLPLDLAPEDICGGRLSQESYQARAKSIREHAEFRRRVSRLLADRFAAKAPTMHVEQRIYDGFPSRNDQARMADFHRRDWPARPDIVASLQDDRLRELGNRIASEHNDLLSDYERQKWQAWRRDRLLTEDEVPWLTVPRAIEKIIELSEGASPDQRRQLADIEQFLTALVGENATLLRVPLGLALGAAWPKKQKNSEQSLQCRP